MATSPRYPVQLTVDYPDRPLDRVSTFFRILFILPIGVIVALLMGGGAKVAGGGLLVLPLLLMIVFRRKYPKWWYDWNLSLARFLYRVAAYAALLSDEYPSTDKEQYVHVSFPYPDARKDLNRWLPLVKWFLAIPHFIVLALLSVAAAIIIVVAWFAILFTGRYPRPFFDLVAGVFRWHLRVLCYAGLMVTDQYPPFSLED